MGAGSYESDTLQALVDRVFDVESDSLDPEEGVLNWKGRSFQLGQGRMMRARFVRYLNTPVNSMDSRLYLSLLDQIQGRLSTLSQASDQTNEEDPWKPVISAWKLLFQATEFDVDGGNSGVIANLVYDNWRDRELFLNRQFREDIEAAERDRLEDSVLIETRKEETRRVQKAEELSRLRQDGIDAPTLDGGGLTPLAQAMKRLAEQEAQLAAQGLKIEEIGLKARLKMQSQIISFLSQRRFKHALILCSFYRTLFKSSAQDLEVGGEQLISYMPELEMIPTVDSLEFIALQAIDDVRTGMDSVNNAYDQGQLISALERLQETFFLGEYSLEVVLFPEEKKRVLRELYFDLDEAQRLVELKDFGALEELIFSISRMADDFPDREALSAVRVAKQASRMKLLGARGALLRGEVEEAQTMLDESFQIWPLNPEIENFMTETVSSADHVTDFDVDYESGDYRRIFDQREAYIAALSGDEVRAERLRESIEIVQTIDFGIHAAEERLDRGEPYAAWEVLKEIEEVAGDDRRYHRTLSSIVPGIARFVAAVDEAESLEEQGNYAAALTKFAAAQKFFPASQVVARGIERLAGQMLDQAREIQENQEAAPPVP
ncbi:hypothetical protein [Puniceicoccus vermicola]|uniref:Uncharacterized protein n=1 Tax=Puniceicoccus vermicola TaxID=388746 RepID=A0A7X1AY30_9BACT|nr:hypothetical protein [Puniceicoccus vermicola]MBC2602108.1 hypothetical protein [Puniceicoccus vermicola]